MWGCVIINIFENLNIPEHGESFIYLYEKDGVLIERIVSSDILEVKEYNQPYDEWIVLLEGEARLEVNNKEIFLHKGDTSLLEKNIPHKVLSTKKGTIWLCIHLKKS